ncbi:MAG: hypothetical protein QOH70_3474 [Blastocatellia bacterium]|jgi:hypothetical protein|nr:hypothetical protein [Blastocatellia bacterium]
MIADIQTGQSSGDLVWSVPIKALPTPENGWPPRPFQIVSLLDMFSFDPKQLATSLHYLTTVSYGLKNNEAPEKLDELPEEAKAVHVINSLKGLKTVCDASGLDTSSRLIDDALRMVTATETWKPNNRVIEGRVDGVYATVLAELRGITFLRINKSDKDFFDNESLFGEEVAASFSHAKYDIAEAGKCLGLNRSTACVLHLMRVLEIGLNSLANQFQVPFAHVNWNEVIEQVEKKIKNIEKDPNKPATWKDDRKFYSEAANQFRYFKDSWRNYAMHIYDKYTPEEALIVYTSVKVFMEQIAKRLKQP